MLQFNPNDPGDTPFKLQRAVKESGLSLQQVCDRMKSDYGVEHAIRCGELLAEQKARLNHGEFKPWIETNCDFGYKARGRSVN